MAPFFLQRRGGAGVGRVFAFASIANQPHTLENIYVPGSGVGASTIANRRALSRRAAYIRPKPVIPPVLFIYSKDNVTDGGFTVGTQIEDIEDERSKDMRNRDYTDQFDPNDDYPEFFPNMAPFIDENVVLGDKDEDDRLVASHWRDINNIFDDWGFFYLYDVNSGKYYLPIIGPQNEDDGLLFTQTFNAFGRTFTIKHGWAVQGIFKFDISVADSRPFKFGGYGNMDWGNTNGLTEGLTHNYTIGGQNLTLYYNKDQLINNNDERLYTYWIPKKVSENSAKTYDIYYDGDDMSMMSKNITTGLIVYFARSNDVKDWVINDLAI